MTNQIAYDLAVIGGGSGGMAAARRAAEHGERVVLFESDAMGGTCVNAGCVPKKLLVHASRMRDALAEMPGLGWTVGENAFDWPTLRDAVQRELERLSRGHKERLKEKGITLVSERAALAGPKSVQAGRRTYRAERILVATGAAPIRPDIPGADLAIVSDDVFVLDELPERLAIVGGGYIAVEFACLFARFGTQVTIIERGERLLGPFDPEIAMLLESAMAGQGIEVIMNTEVSAVGGEIGELTLKLGGVGPRSFDQVLMAVGRRPNTDGLRLDRLGIVTDDRGRIVADDVGQTNIPSIFAVGDVTAAVALTPVAIRQARRMVDVASTLHSPLPPPGLVPTAAFTTPECASVGMTEDEARASDVAFEVTRSQFRPLAALLAGTEAEVFMKAIVARRTGEILGMHFFGPHASEAAQLACVAMTSKLSAGELDRTMPLHPSVAEELLGLGRSAEPLHVRSAASDPARAAA